MSKKHSNASPTLFNPITFDASFVVGYNKGAAPPDNADILLHHSPKDGVRPYIESEGSPAKTPGGYWGSFSKSDGYYNYIRIGRQQRILNSKPKSLEDLHQLL